MPKSRKPPGGEIDPRRIFDQIDIDDVKKWLACDEEAGKRVWVQRFEVNGQCFSAFDLLLMKGKTVARTFGLRGKEEAKDIASEAFLRLLKTMKQGNRENQRAKKTPPRKIGVKSMPGVHARKKYKFDAIEPFTKFVYKSYESRARDSAVELLENQACPLLPDDAPAVIILRHFKRYAPEIIGRERVETIISAMKTGFERELSRKKALRQSFDRIHQILSDYAVDPWAWADFLDGSRLYNNIVTDQEVPYPDRTRLRKLWAGFRTRFIETAEGRELRRVLTVTERERGGGP